MTLAVGGEWLTDNLYGLRSNIPIKLDLLATWHNFRHLLDSLHPLLLSPRLPSITGEAVPDGSTQVH